MAAIRVGVVDEHEVFRRGIIACLRDDSRLTVVAVPEDADVLVLSMAAARTPAHCPAIVCFGRRQEAATLADRDDVFAVLPRRSVTPEQIVSAVHAAAAGLRVTVAGEDVRELKERNRDVLRLLATGADTREISQELGYSERTIKAAIAEVSARLGARSRAQAVAEAVRQNLI